MEITLQDQPTDSIIRKLTNSLYLNVLFNFLIQIVDFGVVKGVKKEPLNQV